MEVTVVEQFDQVVLEVADAFLDHLGILVCLVPQSPGLGLGELGYVFSLGVLEDLFVQFFEGFEAEVK